MLLLPDTSAGHFRISVRKLRNQGFGLQICGKKKGNLLQNQQMPFLYVVQGHQTLKNFSAIIIMILRV